MKTIYGRGRGGLTETKYCSGEDEEPSCPMDLERPEGAHIEGVASRAEGEG